MVDDVSAESSEEDGSDSDLAAALDFSPTGDHDEGSALDALDGYAPVDKQDVDDSQGPLFTAANPSGTVAVTTYLNGRVQRVDLSPNAAKMTEAQLSHEIIAVAGVAAIKARAALHTFVVGLPRLQGMDSDSADDFVERHLSLPTPEEATAAEAEFAARYARDVD